MTPFKEVPRIAEGGTNVLGYGYTLTSAQKHRKREGKTIYERDRQVEAYEYSKGEFV